MTRRKRRLKVDRSLKPASKAIVEIASSEHAQPHRRPVQPCPEQELVGRHAGNLPERAQEMIGAGRRLIGQCGQRNRSVGIEFDPPHRLGHAFLVAAARACRSAGAASEPAATTAPARRRPSSSNASLSPISRAASASASRGAKRRQGRQARRRESEPPRARHIGDDPLHVGRGEMEREAAVADAMLVPAFVAGAGIAEQDGAGRQHRGALAACDSGRCRWSPRQRRRS